MEDNVWKMREVVRRLQLLQRRTDSIVSYLSERIDAENVTYDLFRALSSPVEELEWRITNIEKCIEDIV